MKEKREMCGNSCHDKGRDGGKTLKFIFKKLYYILYDIIASFLYLQENFKISLHYFPRFYGVRLRIIAHFDAILHAC